MENKLIRIFFLFVLVLSLTACGKYLNDDQESSDNLTVQIEESDEDDQNEGNIGEDVEQKPQENIESDAQISEQEQESKMATITVFYSNADVTGFEYEEMQVDSLSPENVLETLVSKGVLPVDIRELSFMINDVEGKKSILLDLNSVFATTVSNMGSAGEYYTVGALVNTFLDAYECEQLKITVEGDTLFTGHAEYPGYLSRFE